MGAPARSIVVGLEPHRKRAAAQKRQHQERMRISAAARAAIAEARDAEVRASAALKKRVREVCAYADGVCEAAQDAMDRAAKRQLVDWHSSSWARAWSEAFAARRAGILSRATAVPRQL